MIVSIASVKRTNGSAANDDSEPGIMPKPALQKLITE